MVDPAGQVGSTSSLSHQSACDFVVDLGGSAATNSCAQCCGITNLAAMSTLCRSTIPFHIRSRLSLVQGLD